MAVGRWAWIGGGSGGGISKQTFKREVQLPRTTSEQVQIAGTRTQLDSEIVIHFIGSETRNRITFYATSLELPE